MTTSFLRAGVLALAAFAAGAGASVASSRPEAVAAAAPAKPSIGDVQKIEDFQALFDADRGKYRIVVLLSPT